MMPLPPCCLLLIAIPSAAAPSPASPLGARGESPGMFLAAPGARPSPSFQDTAASPEARPSQPVQDTAAAPRRWRSSRWRARFRGIDSIRGKRVTVLYWPKDSLRAPGILWRLENQPPFPGLDPGLPSRGRIYLAPSEPLFRMLTAGRAPDWGAAVTMPRTATIVLPTSVSNRTRWTSESHVLRHEWAHLALHERLKGLIIPRWFNEGYANWVSGGWDVLEGWRLRLALVGGDAPKLAGLSLSWPRGRSSAELAYMLSTTAVEYLVEESGEEGLAYFFAKWSEERSFDQAIRSVYGVTPSQFEEDWRKYVKRRYGWVLVFTHSLLFWLFLGLLLLVMVRIRRGRNRAAMARLRATEPPEDPAFWKGAPESRGGAKPDRPVGRGDAPELDGGRP